MSAALGLEIQAINQPPPGSSGKAVQEYEITCRFCLYLFAFFQRSKVSTLQMSLKVSTENRRVTVTGHVGTAVQHECLRSAASSAKDEISAIEGVDISAVGVDYGTV